MCINKINNILIYLIESENNENYNTTKLAEYFLSKDVPNITISKYNIRISEYLDEPIMIVAIIYLIKLRDLYPESFYPCEKNIHRLWLACLLLGYKYWEDDCYEDKFIAELGGINIVELIFLEKKIWEYLGYNLSIDFNLYNEISNIVKIDF